MKLKPQLMKKLIIRRMAELPHELQSTFSMKFMDMGSD